MTAPMVQVFRALVGAAVCFLAAVVVYVVFDVDAGPWLVIAAVAANLPRRRRRCCECDD